MKSLAAVIMCIAVVLPSSAYGADPDPLEFTPRGYEFCGWRDLTSGGWAMQWRDELSGAFLVLFADDISCQAARRNYTKLRHSTKPPYRPIRAGYRRLTLKRAHEYLDVRCVKRGSSAKFRYQTGA